MHPLLRTALPGLLALSAAAGCHGAGSDPSGPITSGSGGATTLSTSTTSAAIGGAGGASAAVGGAGGGSTGGTAPVVDAGPACSPDVPRTVPLAVFVEPAAGQAPFVDALSKATSSIRVMVYEMGYGSILDTLLAKAKAGVSVRVILDLSKQSINQKYFDMLAAAGAEVAFSDPKFTYMHAKAIVIDDAEAVISTGNYLASQMAKERNYVVRDADPADVASLAALFDADWIHASPDLSCTRLLVSPINARDRIISLITSATSTLDIESMQFADFKVRDAVLDRKNAGVSVRVILADVGWINSNASAATFLVENEIPRSTSSRRRSTSKPSPWTGRGPISGPRTSRIRRSTRTARSA